MPFKTQRKTLTTAIGYGLLTLIAGNAFAAIEEVTVTAEKREESLQNTPIAISALSGDTLKNLGITSFEGVAKASPSISLTPYPSSSNILILYMRGQGVSDPMQITADGSVGLYEDGFYISRPQAATFDLADIERVEVLRGPQGTLYGRNTTGGAVNLISKKPSGEFALKQDLTFGSRGLFRSLTTVDLPKWNDISTKFTVLKSSKDGYVKNIGSSHDFGEEEQLAGRFSLHWDGVEHLTVDYFAEGGSLDSTPVYYQSAAKSGMTILQPDGTAYAYHADASNPKYKTYRPIDLDQSTSRFEGHGLTVAYDVNDQLTLKSLTGYRKLTWHAYQDYAEGFNLIGNGFILPLTYRTDDEVNSHQFSQEFQAIGSFLDEQFKYVGGIYYFNEGGDHDEIQDTGIAFTPFGASDRYVKAEAKSKAIYAQLTWTPPFLDNKLDATLGLRETWDSRSAKRSIVGPDTFDPNYPAVINYIVKENGLKNSQSFKQFNPMFTVNYKWTDDLSTYAKIATGYKAGGSSESSAAGQFNNSTFDPEKVTTYELGLKSQWFDNTVRVNAALFRSKFKDMQLAFVADPNNNGVIQAYNAGKATVDGLEFELLVQPFEDLTLGLDYAWLHARFDRVDGVAGSLFDPAVNPQSPYQVGDDIKDVLVMPYAPKNTVNLSADYTFLHFDTGNVALHLDYRYQSKIYDTATAGPDVPGRDFYSVPGYGVWNGRVTLTTDLPRGDQVKFGVFAKNLFNKQYRTQVTGSGGPIAVQATDAGGPYIVPAGFNSSADAWAEPATYGVDISYRY